MMHRNSSAIAKQVLNKYENDDDGLDKEIKTNPNIFDSASSIQQNEYLRLEKEIAKLQNKNAQLVETLQVIRLKGEMEGIELNNTKNLKNANKQIQTQRQLMYQYANILRRNKIPIPELQASLQENESSSDSDSDDDDSSSSQD